MDNTKQMKAKLRFLRRQYIEFLEKLLDKVTDKSHRAKVQTMYDILTNKTKVPSMMFLERLGRILENMKNRKGKKEANSELRSDILMLERRLTKLKSEALETDSLIKDESDPNKFGHSSKMVPIKEHVIHPVICLDSSDDDDIQIVSEEIVKAPKRGSIEEGEIVDYSDIDSNSNCSKQNQALTQVLEQNVIKGDSIINNTSDLRGSPVLVDPISSAAKVLTIISPSITTSTVSTSLIASITASKTLTNLATSIKSIDTSGENQENNIQTREEMEMNNETLGKHNTKDCENPSTNGNESQILATEEELVSINNSEDKPATFNSENPETTEIPKSSEKVPISEKTTSLENEDDNFQIVYEIITEDDNNSNEKLTTPTDYSEIEKSASTDAKANDDCSDILKKINDQLSDISSEADAAPDVYMQLIQRIDNSNGSNIEQNESDEENLLEVVSEENLELQNAKRFSNDENNEHSISESDEILDIDDMDTQNFLEKLDAELIDQNDCSRNEKDGKKIKRKRKRRRKSKKSCKINERNTDGNQRCFIRLQMEDGRINCLGEKSFGLENTHLSPKKCLDDLRKFEIENPKISPDKFNTKRKEKNLVKTLSEPETIKSPQKKENNSDIIVIEDDVDKSSEDKDGDDRISLNKIALQADVINITDDEFDLNGVYDGDELIGTRRARASELARKNNETEILFEISSLHAKHCEAIVDVQTSANEAKDSTSDSHRQLLATYVPDNNEVSSQSNEVPKDFGERAGNEVNDKNQSKPENEEDKENEIPNSPNKEDLPKGTVESVNNTECDNISNCIDNWENKSLDELHILRMNLEKEFGFNLNDVFASVNPDELEDTSDFSDQLLSSVPEPEHVQMTVPSILHYGELSHMVAAPHPVPPPQLLAPPQTVPPPDMCNWPQFHNIPYLGTSIQNSSDLSPYLGLPQGIKTNDPRLGNRLRLLYDKTKESQRLQIPTSRIPQLPYPSDVLGAKSSDAVQHEIRSICLKQIVPTTTSNNSQTSQQNSSNFTTLSKNNQVRTYAEYRKLKMEAAARKQAAIDAANKALEIESQNHEKSKVTKKRKCNEKQLIDTEVSDGKENLSNLSSSESSDNKIKHRKPKKPRVIETSSDENQGPDDVWSVYNEIPNSPNNKTLRTLKLRKVSTENDANDRRGSKSSDESEMKDKHSLPVSSNDQESLQKLKTALLDSMNTKHSYECLLEILKPVVSASEFEGIQKILSCDSTTKSSQFTYGKSKEPTSMKNVENEPIEKCLENRNIKKGYRELEILNRDIQSMFIRDGVLTARGRRVCSIISEQRTGVQMNVENGNVQHKELNPTSVANFLPETENIKLPHHGDKDDETDNFELTTCANRLKKYTKTRPKVKCSSRIRKEFCERKAIVKLRRVKDNSDFALLRAVKEIPYAETVKKGRQQKSKAGKSILVYNTNPEHHIRSKYMKKCILCPKTSQNMVEHYRNSHAGNEVFISRLHFSDLEYITKTPIIATTIPGQKGHSGLCLFCEKEVMDSFSNFNYHFSSHTGEYGFECLECGMEKSCKKSIVDHCAKQCKKDAKWRRLFSYDKDMSKINAFVCSKCNYIQLHRIHVIQHLENQHSITKPTDLDIDVITLIQKIDTEERSTDITVANEPVSIKTDELDFPNYSEDTVSLTDKEKCEYEIGEEAISIKTEIDLHKMLQSTLNKEPVPSAVGKVCEGKLIFVDIPLNDTKYTNEMLDVEPSIDDSQKCVETSQNEDQPMPEEVIADNVQQMEKTNIDCENDQDNFDNVNYLRNDLICLEVQSLSEQSKDNNCDRQIATNVNKTKPVSPTLVSTNAEGDNETQEKEAANDGPVNSKDAEIEETEEAVRILKSIQDDERSNDLDDSAQKLVIDLSDGTENSSPLTSKTPAFDTGEKRVIENSINTHLEVNTTKTAPQAEQNLVMVENINFVRKHLKPWLDTTSSKKTKPLCDNMSYEKSLFCFYKCMGDDCSFTTTINSAMMSHIFNHKLAKTGESPLKSWLECSYCDHIFSAEVNLMHHINDVHKTSKFQCSLCFYRSCHAYNVFLHIKMHHVLQKSALILVCPGAKKAINSDLELMNKLKENVKPIHCEVCNIEFFVIESLENHLQSVHNMKQKLDSTKIGMFACIYCTFENNNIFLMRKHMANKHPSELLYICARFNYRSNVNALNVTKNSSEVENCYIVFVGQTVDINLFKKCTYTDVELNSSENNEHVIDLTVTSNDDVTQGTLYRDSNVQINETLGIITYEKFETILNNYENMGMEINESDLHFELKCLVKRSKRILARKTPFLFKCVVPNCQEALQNRREWDLHVGGHRKPCDVEYNCPYCPCKYQIRDFSDHIYRHQFKHYFCYYCGEIFQAYGESEYHLKTSHFRINPKLMSLPQEFNTTLEATSSSSVDDTHENYVILSGDTLVMKDFTMVLKNRWGSSKLRKNTTNQRNTVHLTKHTSKILEMINKEPPKFVVQKIRFTCGVDSCKDILANESSINIHLKEKHKNPIHFQCAHCSYSIGYPGTALVKEHLKYHGKVIYVCCFCDFVATLQNDINRHLIKTHKGISYYIYYNRLENQSMRRIEKLHMKKPESLTKQCLFCDNIMTYDEMLFHVRTVHDLQLLYRCHHCTFEDMKYQEVVNHLDLFHKKPFRMKEIYILCNTIEKVIQNPLLDNSNEKVETRLENVSTNFNLQRKRSASANERENTEQEHTCPKPLKTLRCSIFYCPKCSHMLESEQLLTEHMSQLHGLPLPIPFASNYCDKNKTVQEEQVPSTINNNTFICSPSTIDDSSNRNDLVINIENSISQTKPMVNVTVSFMDKEKLVSTNADLNCIPPSSNVEPMQKHVGLRLVPLSKLLREDLKPSTENVMVVDSDDEFIDVPQAISREYLKNTEENNTNQSFQSMSQSAISISSSDSNANEYEFHCFYCQVKCKTPEDVILHWQEAHKTKAISFKFCISKISNAFMNFAFLTERKLAELKNVGTQTTALKCPTCLCKFYATNYFTTPEHRCPTPLLSIPQASVSYGCSLCNSALIFDKPNLAVKHIHKHHIQHHSCEFCSQYFTSYRRLQLHSITIHGSLNETLMLKVVNDNYVVYNTMYVFFGNGFTAYRYMLKNTCYGSEADLKRLIEIVENEN